MRSCCLIPPRRNEFFLYDDDEEELYGIDSNNNPTSDGDKSEGETEEVSKEMTASAKDETTIPEPIDSDKSKQQRASEEESK